MAFALTGALLLMFYSGGPFPLKYIGLGEFAVFIIWGPLMIGGTYYVMAEELPGWVLLASVPLDGRDSLYARWGDWLAWACWAALAVLLLFWRVTSQESKAASGDAA